MTTEIKTPSGFVCEIDEDVVYDNYELLELLIRLDRGERAVLPEVLDMVLGHEQTDALKTYLREAEGKVATSSVHRELLEIFRGSRKGKN